MKKSWGIVFLAMLMFAPSATAMSSSKHIDPCWLLAHTPVTPGAQTITVVNQAGVKPENLCRVEVAVQEQAWQLRVAWGTPPITFRAGGWDVYLDRNSSETGGIFGAHFYRCSGPYCNACVGVLQCSTDSFAPYAVVDTQGGCLNTRCIQRQPWSVGFSHEIMEMLVDPTGNGRPEVCDPVWRESYWLDGVLVQRFVAYVNE